MTKRKIKMIIQAYDNGLTLQGMSMLFKLTEHEIINIVHIIKCARENEPKRKRNEKI